MEIPNVKNNYVSESKGQWEATDCRWLLDQIALEELGPEFEAQGHKRVAHVAPCYRHESVPSHCNKLCQFSRLRSWDRAAFTDETRYMQMIQLLAEVTVQSVAQSSQQWVWHSGWRRQIFCRGHGPLFATSQQRPNEVKTLQSVPNDLLKENIHQTLIRDQKDSYNLYYLHHVNHIHWFTVWQPHAGGLWEPAWSVHRSSNQSWSLTATWPSMFHAVASADAA